MLLALGLLSLEETVLNSLGGLVTGALIGFVSGAIIGGAVAALGGAFFGKRRPAIIGVMAGALAGSAAGAVAGGAAPTAALGTILFSGYISMFVGGCIGLSAATIFAAFIRQEGGDKSTAQAARDQEWNNFFKERSTRS